MSLVGVRPVVRHNRARPREHSLDFLVLPHGRSLEDDLVSGNEFAIKLRREALILFDRANVIPGLRERFL